MLNSIFGPTGDWSDTPEQAQVRACVIGALDGLSPIEQIKIASELIALLRDQLLTALSNARKQAAQDARAAGLSPGDIVVETGLSQPTVARLLYEGKRWAVTE